MPRASSKQTTTRTGAAESTIATPTETVTAGRLNISNPHMNVQRSRANGKIAIADAMVGLGKSINKVMEKNKIKKESAMVADAKKQAHLDTFAGVDYGIQSASNKENFPDLYNNAYSTQAAASRGHQAAQENHVEMLEGDYKDEASYDAAQTAKLASDLEGIEDPAFINTYVQIVSGAADKTKAAWQQKRNTEELAAGHADYNQGLRGQTRVVVDQSSDDTVLANLNAMEREFRANGKVLGYSNEDMNDMWFNAVKEIAIESEMPELYDVFEMDVQRIEDPTQTQPGLSDVPDYQMKIAEGRAKAEANRARKLSGRNEQVKFATLKEIEAANRAKDYGEADRLINKAVNETEVLTASEGMSQLKATMDASDKAVKMERAGVLRADGMGYEANSVGITTGEYQTAVNERYRQGRIDAGDDQSAMWAHEQKTVRESVADGFVPKVHKDVMVNANPSNPEQWTRALATWNLYRSVDPAFAASIIPDAVDQRFHFYSAMLENGTTPDQALVVLTTMNDPARIEKVMGTDRRAYTQDIKDTLINSGASSGWYDMVNNDTVNGTYVQDQVIASALLYTANTGSGSEDAIDWAMTNFQKTHRVIQSPDGRQRWAYTGGRVLPDIFAEAHQGISDAASAKWKGDATNGSESGYYLSPNPHNKTSNDWILYNGDTGMPVTVVGEDGNARPMKENINELMAKQKRANDFRDAPTPAEIAEEAAETQAENAADQAREEASRRQRDKRKSKFTKEEALDDATPSFSSGRKHNKRRKTRGPKSYTHDDPAFEKKKGKGRNK